MAAFSLTLDRAQELIAAVEQALRDGYAPSTLHGSHARSCVRIVADRYGMVPQSLRGMVGSPTHPGSIYRNFGLLVDWSQFRPAPPEAPAEAAPGSSPTPPAPPNPPPAPPPPADPIELVRLRDDNTRLKRERDELARRAASLEDVRRDVLGLMDLPPAPVAFPAREVSALQAETVVLFLSDLQWGETVDISGMDGLNSYSVEIARARLGRWTNAVVDLVTQHWSGPPPDRIILILGGDLISGGIHMELAKTDELRPIPAVRDVADHLRTAILAIHEKVAVPVDVISLAGNHGRSTLKYESKEAASTSYDILVSDFLEMGLRGQAGISFYAPASPDALFSVYGWRVLATHGDRIGARGGQGFVGPAATAARGMKRVSADYAARGVHLDLILIGHLHTRMLLEEGIVNGSLVGPSEFSRDGRFRPLPAVQLFLTIHPRHLLAQLRWIEVGAPTEGSLYEPPPPDRALRPRYRVQAGSRMS